MSFSASAAAEPAAATAARAVERHGPGGRTLKPLTGARPGDDERGDVESRNGATPESADGGVSWPRRIAAIVLVVAAAAAAAAALTSPAALSAGAAAGAGPPVDAPASVYGPGAPIDFPLFPANNLWNTDISSYPVDPRSDRYLASIGLDTGLHPDFGTVWEGRPIGIPYVVVSGNQPKVPISFYYGDESDPGPYPIPPDAPIEGGPNSDGDRHILVLDADHKLLYEVYDAHPAGGGWEAGSGAVFDLTTNALRPEGWTSADAAGLPILPGLVHYDEVQRGEIRHALRFTVSQTQRAYRYPATHYASDSTDPDLPPMGLRVRLKAGIDTSGFPPEVRVILQALKTYGMFVADNGADWYISGAPDPRWDDDALHAIGGITGRDFEVVDTSATSASSTTTLGPTTTTTTLGPTTTLPVPTTTVSPTTTALPPPSTTTTTNLPPISTTTTTIPTAPVFSDIDGNPYEEAILGLARAGIVGGYLGLAGPEFRPYALVYRAQFAKMVCGALFLPVLESMVPPFDDLGSDDPVSLYPHEYVAAAAAEGITQGTGPRQFDPYESITRAQTVTMIVRGAESRAPSALRPPPTGYVGSFSGFSEVHGPAMRVGEYNGLLQGLQGFGPGWDPWAAATRAEVAQMLWNLMDQ